MNLFSSLKFLLIGSITLLTYWSCAADLAVPPPASATFRRRGFTLSVSVQSHSTHRCTVQYSTDRFIINNNIIVFVHLNLGLYKLQKKIRQIH
ncbi:Uncharacterized protein APZ42_001623 [Daphnia magna]|uniref:Secreted protein n=1 Tax=Daphnia magna TaxID=35525 RepID=A0A164IV04_9CRUS|nr:Uncharacterized protein APZ42_001623 [Daphnia magna]